MPRLRLSLRLLTMLEISVDPGATTIPNSSVPVLSLSPNNSAMTTCASDNLHKQVNKTIPVIFFIHSSCTALLAQVSHFLFSNTSSFTFSMDNDAPFPNCRIMETASDILIGKKVTFFFSLTQILPEDGVGADGKKIEQ
jgi:hypothetical protein